MFKFLRRYNKWILAVGGVLLMITFLIPQAITRLSQYAAERKATFAKVGNGESVSVTEWNTVQNEIQFMEKVERLGLVIRGVGKIQSPAHWFLLVREARQAGLVGAASLSDQDLNMIAAVTQQHDPEFIRQAVGKMNGVNLMISLFDSAEFSDRRTKAFAQRMMHVCGAEMVILQADKDKAGVEPTED